MNALTPITAGDRKMNRGRPAGQMTQRRQQVLTAYADIIASGQEVRLAELARRCGLWSYSDARRVLNDLDRMGKLV